MLMVCAMCVHVCVDLPHACVCTVQAEMRLDPQALHSVPFAHLPVGELGKGFTLRCLSFPVQMLTGLTRGTAVAIVSEHMERTQCPVEGSRSAVVTYSAFLCLLIQGSWRISVTSCSNRGMKGSLEVTRLQATSTCTYGNRACTQTQTDA